MSRGGVVRILIVTRRRTLDLSIDRTEDSAPNDQPRGDVYSSTERADDYADPELDARRFTGFWPVRGGQ